MNSFIKIVSTFFYSGYFPKMPGTFGTLTGAVLYYFITVCFEPSPMQFCFITLIIIGISIIFSHYSIKIFNTSDPNVVVIDEVAGFFVAVLFIPFSVLNLVTAFLLFRLFDVWKPLFVKNCEQFSGGLGITMDDVAAGVLANVCLRIIIF
jgi:phosphatidylglycerophosphatase A